MLFSMEDNSLGSVLSVVSTAVSAACTRLLASEELVQASQKAAAAAATAVIKSGGTAAAKIGTFAGVVAAGGSDSVAHEILEELSTQIVSIEAKVLSTRLKRSASVSDVIDRTQGNWGLLGRILADVVRDTCGVDMFDRLEKIRAVCTAFRGASSAEAESMKLQLGELCAGTAAQVRIRWIHVLDTD